MATPTNLPSAFTDNTGLPAATLNDLRGAFRVLQVFSVQGTTRQDSATTTFVDITGLTVTITPQATTSKILLISANSLLASNAAADGAIRFLRGATNIFTSVQGLFVANSGASVVSMFFDSPNTTSAVVYKVQFNRNFGTGTLISTVGNTLSHFTVCEISA